MPLPVDPAMRARFRGCLAGLAIGDSLGAAVAGASRDEIVARFGDAGIQDLHPWTSSGLMHPKGTFTCETQLALATAYGCVATVKRLADGEPADLPREVFQRYVYWLEVQDESGDVEHLGLISSEAVRTGRMGTITDPLNDSDAHDVVVRVAPVGLALTPGQAFLCGSDVAALTHGSPSALDSAGAFADMVSMVVRGDRMRDAAQTVHARLVREGRDSATIESLGAAIESAAHPVAPDRAPESLGSGESAHDALAVGVFAAIVHTGDYAMGVLCAANAGGRTTATTAIAGALLGASVGDMGIPGSWILAVQDRRRLIRVADEIYNAQCELPERV